MFKLSGGNAISIAQGACKQKNSKEIRYHSSRKNATKVRLSLQRQQKAYSPYQRVPSGLPKIADGVKSPYA